MFGNKNKGKKGKVAAAPVAPHKTTKPSKNSNSKRVGMSVYFHESVVETIMPDFKSNAPFEVVRNGKPAYMGLLFDTNDIGGFSKQFSDDEAKGTIIEMINSNRIKALITANLMARECMILIPDAVTIENMSEFAAFTDISYKLCAVTDTGMTELDTTVTFAQVKGILDGGGNVRDIMNEADYDKVDDPEDEEPEDSGVAGFDSESEDDDDIVGNGPDEDGMFPEEDEDDGPEGFFEDDDEDDPPFESGGMFVPDEDEDDDYGTEDDYDNTPSDYVEDDEEVEPEEEDEPEDVDAEYVNATKIRRFYSNDLGMEVTTEPFDSQFLNSNPFVPFEEDRGDGWLDGYVSQMARDANSEMRRHHQNNLMMLRERYFRLIQAQCGKIARDLDLDDQETMYGNIAAKFMAEKAERLRGAVDEISLRRGEIQKAWEEKLQKEGEDAAREAQRIYEERYGRQHSDDLLAVEHIVRSGIENDYEQKMRELRDRRHTEAMKRLDMSINETLTEISDMYLECAKNETMRCKELQNNMISFMDKHRKEDAARVSVLAEKQAQEQKADKVLAEQTEKLNRMTADFDAKNKAIHADLERMRQKYSDDMKQRDREYDDMVSKKDAFAQSLQKRIDDMTAQMAQMDEKKKQEYSSRMQELESERDAWEDKCDHLIQVHKRSNVLSGLLVVVVIAACLAIGFVGGQYANSQKNMEATQNRIMQSVDQRIDDAQQKGIESQAEFE